MSPKWRLRERLYTTKYYCDRCPAEKSEAASHLCRDMTQRRQNDYDVCLLVMKIIRLFSTKAFIKSPLVPKWGSAKKLINKISVKLSPVETIEACSHSQYWTLSKSFVIRPFSFSGNEFKYLVKTKFLPISSPCKLFGLPPLNLCFLCYLSVSLKHSSKCASVMLKSF